MAKVRRTTETVTARDGGTYERPLIEVRCCGQWLTVSGRFTTTCEDCGTDYNSSGQTLAPREFWGEETGEHWTDGY